MISDRYRTSACRSGKAFVHERHEITRTTQSKGEQGADLIIHVWNEQIKFTTDVRKLSLPRFSLKKECGDFQKEELAYSWFKDERNDDVTFAVFER